MVYSIQTSQQKFARVSYCYVPRHSNLKRYQRFQISASDGVGVRTSVTKIGRFISVHGTENLSLRII